MKNKYYKAHIIERFMSKPEQEDFDRRYREYKVVSMGINASKNLKWYEKLLGGGER